MKNADDRAKDEPWHPMTNPVDLKVLGKMNEELAELISAASRCMIQGIDEEHPISGIPNGIWLQEELADALAGIELTIERFFHDSVKPIQDRKYFKKKRLREWHEAA